ncbi:MAG: NAD(P)H-dependent glycerol-3-phosphate dehydrogenase [bacterium]
MLNKNNIAIIGGGSWGTAISVLLGSECETGKKELNIKLWIRRNELAQEITQKRVNSEYLPGVNIPKTVNITTSIKEAVVDANLIIIAVPSQYLRSIIKEIYSYINKGSIICSASKGIEIGSFKRMSEIIHEEIDIPKKNIAVISGPSHAEEVSTGKVTTVVVASSSDETAGYIQRILNTQTFRVYTSRDVKGVEYGGALKNIIAIGAGICDGLQKIDYAEEKMMIGDNAKASLLTRGIEEIARLGIMLGSRKRTFYGLSGWGDLLVTSYSRFGRNRLVGECLAMGMNLEQIKKEKLHGMVPEGVETTKAVYELSKIINVEMPITEQIYYILYENKDIKTAIYDLMNRSLKPEHGYYIKGIPKRIILAWRNRI